LDTFIGDRSYTTCTLDKADLIYLGLVDHVLGVTPCSAADLLGIRPPPYRKS
jgi:hypothetical protein